MLRLFALLLLVGCTTSTSDETVDIVVDTKDRAYPTDAEDSRADKWAKEYCLSRGYSDVQLMRAFAGCHHEPSDGAAKCSVTYRYECINSIEK